MVTCFDRETKSQGGVLTMGVFDGIHRGHRHLLSTCLTIARRLDTFVEVWIFHPHPRSILRGIEVPALTTVEERIALLHELGVSRVRVITFTKQFSTLSAEEFVTEWIQTLAAPRAVVLGYDHRFGSERRGSSDLLRQMGLIVEEVPPYKEGGEPISSSRIRKLLAEGMVRAARVLLGYPFTITGIVRAGKGEARRLGIPTANIPYPMEKVRLAAGIYIGWVHIDPVPVMPREGGLPGLLYIPPAGDAEVHILDRTLPELYGRKLSVGFWEYLRPHKAFATPEELHAAISSDLEKAREHFRGVQDNKWP
ncbi:MAG: riboflavin biosynthesis protein RibF [Bacteroidia bacterium]